MPDKIPRVMPTKAAKMMATSASTNVPLKEFTIKVDVFSRFWKLRLKNGFLNAINDDPRLSVRLASYFWLSSCNVVPT